MKALRYFFCIFFPPIAVLLTGRVGSFVLSIILTFAAFWIGGVIHAVLVVNDYEQEERANRMANGFLR